MNKLKTSFWQGLTYIFTMRRPARRIFLLFFLTYSLTTHAQHYTALQGTSYSPSLTVHHNPASIANAPHPWEVTLFGLQERHSTNVVDILNYSLISRPSKSEYQISPGNFARRGTLQANVNLLNTRVALNRNNAIAFGFNIRSYFSLKSSRYQFVDTARRFFDFFNMNPDEPEVEANGAGSSWAEFYLSYARTLADNERFRLTGGATLKLNKGLSAGFVSLDDGRFTRTGRDEPFNYTIKSANLDIGYSENFDRWDSAASFGNNAKEFLRGTKTGFSADVGIEYIRRLPSALRDDEDYLDYDWKLGVSVLDIGHANYRFGQYSAHFRNIRENTDLLLDQKFDSTIDGMRQVRDSLSTLFENTGAYTGSFKIYHPTRLVVNIDKFINGAFFINADITVPLSGLLPRKGLHIRDLSLITVTPRLETRKKAVYLPVSYNGYNQLWVGAAGRLGPVVLGFHNLGNIISKNKMNRGGGYVAIILRPGKRVMEGKGDRRLECYEF